jgi:hypothetical protein
MNNTKIVYGNSYSYKVIEGTVFYNILENNYYVVYKVEANDAMDRLLLISGLEYKKSIDDIKYINNNGNIFRYVYVYVMTYSIKDVDKLIDMVKLVHKPKSIGYSKQELEWIFNG